MFNIIKQKNWYFLISLLVILPGIVSLLVYGLNLSIDFTGGSRTTYLFSKSVEQPTVTKLQGVYSKDKIHIVSLQKNNKEILVKTPPLTDKQNTVLVSDLKKSVGDFKQEDFETIGPVIGREITINALKSVGFASLLIILYIAWSFRTVPKPASSWKFGICAVIALVHDALVVLGLFSILGHFFHVEIDSLFVTAILTVIGFSVHDTIVVFDRIRENLLKSSGQFGNIVNDSILQTLTRSLNTSFTAMLVLLALLLFGGETVRWFIVALLVGIISGTYSSIFNASALLVAWQEWDEKRRKS